MKRIENDVNTTLGKDPELTKSEVLSNSNPKLEQNEIKTNIQKVPETSRIIEKENSKN